MADTVFLPILKDNHDPHYRYKMPKLTAKVEGNGNGIKTVLTNISAVAKSLGRPASYPTKYFGCELGAQTQMQVQDDLYIVNGSHDPDRLLNLLYAFIKRFVLCPKCSNPETDLSVTGNGVINQKCNACGHANVIARGSHRLTTFIVSHPPSGSQNTTAAAATGGSGDKQNGAGTKEKSGGKSEKKSTSKKHSKSTTTTTNGGSNGTSNGTSNGSGKTHHSDANNDGDGFDDDDENAFDDQELSEQAYLDRLHDGLATGMFINDPKKSADVFYKLVKAKKEAGVLTDLCVQRELFKEATLLGIKDKASLILGELLFTPTAILDDIVTYRPLLLRFCENHRAQKYLLGAYEKIVGEVHRDALFEKSTKILKQLYDQDILEEETILEWASKESKKYVSKEMSRKIRERVAPFIKWLKEAEQDSEEEDDDDKKKSGGESSSTDQIDKNGKRSGNNSGESSPIEEEESPHEEEDAYEEDDGLVAFSHRVTGLKLQEATSVNGNGRLDDGKSNKENVDDDIDIDNI